MKQSCLNEYTRKDKPLEVTGRSPAEGTSEAALRLRRRVFAHQHRYQPG